jgi:uncharacterized protein (DUF58 family)
VAPRARVVLALFVLSLIAALVTGRDLFYSLLYLWGALFVVSFIWSRIALGGVRIERSPRSLRGQVGRLFVERFSLWNESRLSKLWVEARDSSELPGYRVTTVTVGLGFQGSTDIHGHRSSTVTVDLGPGHQRSWIVRTLCTRRGRFRLGPMVLHSSDPFGLFPVSKEVPHQQHLVVLPMTVPIWSFPLPSGRLPGGDALRQRTHQITPNATNVRDYAPGDSLKRIHWPSTAKRRRLIVKEFEFDPLADVWIMLDAARLPQAKLDEQEADGGGEDWAIGHFRLPPSTEEYAVAAAASIALHFLQRDRAVGMIAYGRVRHVIQPDRGESQLYRVLESLAVLQAIGNHSLEEVIKIEAPRIPRGATVILITPSVDTNYLAALRQLDYGGRSTVLIQIDAESFGGRAGAAAITTAASRQGVPVRILRYGSPLDAALSSSPRSRRITSVA